MKTLEHRADAPEEERRRGRERRAREGLHDNRPRLDHPQARLTRLDERQDRAHRRAEMGARWEQRALLRVGRRRGRRCGRHGGRAAVAILDIVGIVAVAIFVISSRRQARDGLREAHAVRRVQQQVAQCG